jgi:Protein of unknown function (DUF3574)
MPLPIPCPPPRHRDDAVRRSPCFRPARVSSLAVALMFVLPGCMKTHAVMPRAEPETMFLRCTAQMASRLYFGFDTPEGPVTEAAWNAFVQSDISPRLPAGFTLLVASGQWRGDDGVPRREDSRVLEVVGADDAQHRQALIEIVARYKTLFRQESVLLTQSPIRACS